MDRTVLRQVAEAVLPGVTVPERVVVHAQSLVFQSGPLVSLKPAEETARGHICCVIAAERLAAKYDLPKPCLTGAPVPPAVYAKLIDMFREALDPNAKVGTGTSAGLTKARRVDSSPQRKQAEPRVPGRGRGRPRKIEVFKGHIPSAGITKRRDKPPTPGEVVGMCNALKLSPSTTEAVEHARSLYVSLSKDDWGLLLAIIYVVVERAEPDLYGERLFDVVCSTATKRGVSASRSRLDEWVPWARRIVTGQTWISKISIKPEPLPKLRGLPGSWGATPAIV